MDEIQWLVDAWLEEAEHDLISVERLLSFDQMSIHIGRKRCNNLVYSERRKARPGTGNLNSFRPESGN